MDPTDELKLLEFSDDDIYRALGRNVDESAIRALFDDFFNQRGACGK